MPSEITTGKTVLILAAVVGCFAVLWPRLFHPMLQSALYETTKNTLDNTAGKISAWYIHSSLSSAGLAGLHLSYNVSLYVKVFNSPLILHRDVRSVLLTTRDIHI